jgi:menaquinone-dependent protoporphyrinogen oxidase
MTRVLLICSSTDGQTRRICERLREIVEDAGHAVTLTMIEDARELSPAGFAMAVIGARIRYGKTDPRVIAYAGRHAAALAATDSAFFSVNIVARKPAKNRPGTNPYVQAFLKRVAWRPQLLEVFAGKLDYPRYGVLDRNIIRLIMWLTDGPTDPAAVMEFTDWQRVDAFAHALCARLQRSIRYRIDWYGNPACSDRPISQVRLVE